MYRLLASAAMAVALLGAGCAAAPDSKKAEEASAPLAHEYRTGSIMAQKEKRPVTEEERRRAQETAAEIRASPQTIVGRP